MIAASANDFTEKLRGVRKFLQIMKCTWPRGMSFDRTLSLHKKNSDSYVRLVRLPKLRENQVVVGRLVGVVRSLIFVSPFGNFG